MKRSRILVVALLSLLPLAGLPATASAHVRGQGKHQALNSTSKVHTHHHRHHHHAHKKAS